MRSMQSIRVIIVEDEAIILESYQSILENYDYIVAGCAYNGKQALECMPDMNGLDVLKQINVFLEVPCVFITG